MAIGSLIGDAFGGITNRLQQGFSGIQERMAEPNRADPKYHNDPNGEEAYWTDYIDWKGRTDLYNQSLASIPRYKPDFSGAARVGGRRPAGQFTSLMPGPQVSPVAPLYLDPRRRR